MENQILLLASQMLSLASDEFSNKGCNDLDEETMEAIKPIEKSLCAEIRKTITDENYPNDRNDIPNDMLMEYLAIKLKEYITND